MVAAIADCHVLDQFNAYRSSKAVAAQGFWLFSGVPKEGKKQAKGDFRSIKLSNDTHRSCTDPEALLARKSNAHPAQLSYRGHLLMENRHDLIVDCRVTQASGTGERDAAKTQSSPQE